MIHHVGTTTIETERLLLRRFTVDDAQNIFDNWASDEQVTKYLSWKPHRDIQITKNILNTWIEAYEEPDTYNWAIVLEEDSQAIGSISIVDLSEIHKRCEIGYCLSKNYWNKGIMTEALKSVIKFCFLEIGINRVQAIHHSDNPASGKVMIKSGMKYEGRLKQFHINNQGKYVDCDMYAMLKPDCQVEDC